MHIDWLIIGIVLICAILLVVFLIKRNLRDEKDVTEYFNNEYNSNINKESEVDEDEQY